MKYKELIEAHGLTLHGDIEHFAELVAAQEREACAKVCDAVAEEMEVYGEGPTGYISYVEDCAATIRARGNT